jgi:hypothetical protein
VSEDEAVRKVEVKAVEFVKKGGEVYEKVWCSPEVHKVREFF